MAEVENCRPHRPCLMSCTTCAVSRRHPPFLTTAMLTPGAQGEDNAEKKIAVLNKPVTLCEGLKTLCVTMRETFLPSLSRVLLFSAKKTDIAPGFSCIRRLNAQSRFRPREEAWELYLEAGGSLPLHREYVSRSVRRGDEEVGIGFQDALSNLNSPGSRSDRAVGDDVLSIEVIPAASRESSQAGRQYLVRRSAPLNAV